MLDAKDLRNEPEWIAAQLGRRGMTLDLARWNALESRRKILQTEVEGLRNERNARAKAVGQAKARGEAIEALLSQAEDLGQRLDQAEAELAQVQQQLTDFLLQLPNVPAASVPDGKDEKDNVTLRQWGQPPEFPFTPLDHVDLGEAGGHMDFAAAGKLTGARFVVLRGQLARLQRALIQFMLDLHTQRHGYQEVYVPYLVNAQSLLGTGQLPKFEQDLFRLSGEAGYYLIPTAEVPVTNLLRDEIVEAAALPLKLVAHTPCFRSEAGSYGRDVRGMIRQHQFEKVELVQLVRPEDSAQAHEELTAHAEAVLQALELPYRVVALCAGDLGFAAARTYDLEVWLPSQGCYREISSCSNFEAFQARRLRARFRPRAGAKPELLHTLNGSGLAVGRTLVALLENHQDGAGNVRIPAALQPYLGGLSRLMLRD